MIQSTVMSYLWQITLIVHQCSILLIDHPRRISAQCVNSIVSVRIQWDELSCVKPFCFDVSSWLWPVLVAEFPHDNIMTSLSAYRPGGHRFDSHWGRVLDINICSQKCTQPKLCTREKILQKWRQPSVIDHFTHQVIFGISIKNTGFSFKTTNIRLTNTINN